MVILIFFTFNFLELKKLSNKPQIDGIVDTLEEWKGSTIISDFVEYIPKEGKTPTVRTKVYLGWFNESIFIAFLCFEKNINMMRVWSVSRDDLSMYDQDAIVVNINTCNPFRALYVFRVNPKGNMLDALLDEKNIEHVTFDGIWYAQAKIFKNFWSCEIEIPFSFLNCSEIHQICLILERIRPRVKYEVYTFPSISRNNPSWFLQAKCLSIKEKLNIKTKREFIPYIITYKKDKKEKILSKLGFTSNYKFPANLYFLFTLNPDYAQIETDEPKIDVNTTFALFYPEKRPFFMEGKTLIETPIKAIYTRAINDPLFASKITGRLKDFDFLFLSAYDEHTPWVLPFEEKSEYIASDKKSFSNILRIKKSIFEESYIGILTSSRDFKDLKGFNRIFGFDTRLRFKTHYTIDYQGIYSWTREIDDTLLSEEFNGEYLKGFAQEFDFNAFFRNFTGNLCSEIILLILGLIWDL